MKDLTGLVIITFGLYSEAIEQRELDRELNRLVF